MKIKFEITDKVKHLLYRSLAIFLLFSTICMFSGFNIYLSIEFKINNFWVNFFESAIFWLIAIPTWKYYK